MITAMPAASGRISLTVKEYNAKWCVFTHTLRHSASPFYLGLCRLRDVYDFTDAYRNSHWRRTIDEDTEIRVDVLAIADTETEASQALQTLYRSLRPEANVRGAVITGKMVVTCMEGDNAGTTYLTATDAAEKNGISIGAMSNHLNGRRGYETIRGMRFRKGLPE